LITAFGFVINILENIFFFTSRH